MSDFMREVDEEYRRERAVRFLSRYQLLIAAVVVAVVAGAGLWRFAVDRRVAAAAADNIRYGDGEKQARAGDAASARKTFDALAADGVAGYPLLAQMRSAAERAAADPEGAAASFDAVASGEGGSPALRDAARYRGALLRVDREDSKKFEDRYGRFALDSFAFHDGMRELLALAALKRGDGTAAAKYLTDIVIDGAAPVAVRNRAQAFLELTRSGAAQPSDKSAPPASVAPAAAPPQPAAAAPATAPAAAPPAR